MKYLAFAIAHNRLLPCLFTPCQPTRRRRELFKILRKTLVPIQISSIPFKHTKRSEEPSVLSRCVSLLQSLLHGLLRVLPLRLLLECICGNNSLKSLQLERITCWHQVVVVDDLDKWLDLASLGLAGLRHTTGDLRWVTLDTGDQGVWVWVRFASSILGLDDHDLQLLHQSWLSEVRSSLYLVASHGFNLRVLLVLVASLLRWNVGFTFLPAYLPRVMIATRPTFKTVRLKLASRF